MADKKISQLTGATTPLAGTEVLPIVQGGSTVKVSIANVTAGRSISTAGASLDGAVTINDSGADVDFRVKGDTEDNLIFADASADKIGFGTNAPDQRITISGGGTGFNRVNSDLTPANDSKGLVYVRQNGSSSGTAEEMRYLARNHGFYSHAGARIATFNSDANLKVETAGKGIDFSVNTGAAGKSSQLLDDYEEGTWTPIVYGTTTEGTATYTTQKGNYVKVGNLVWAAGRVTYTGHTGTGNMLIKGLPFNATSINTLEPVVTIYGSNIAMTAGNYMVATQRFSAAYIEILQAPTGGGGETAVPMDAAGSLFFTVIYRSA